MVIVLPVCSKDIESALRNIAWCRELDQSCNFPCLISTESGFDTTKLEQLARGYFSAVSILRYPAYPRGLNPRWPRPQNWSWRKTALHMAKAYRDPWLWWEQDAVPLKAGWLEALNAAYVAGNKPFLGTYGAKSNPLNPNHLNGVAIYPPNWQAWCPESMFASEALPFDVCGGWRVMNQATISPLIQHQWSWDNDNAGPPCTFPDTSWMKHVNKDAVLFHRCKDSSLVDRLRERKTGLPTMKDEQRKGKAYVMLGRAGDITNILPVMLEESAQSGIPANFVSSSEFAPLFDGVSYLQPFLLDLTTDRLKVGLHFSRINFAEAINLQVWGDNKAVSHSQSSYNRDAWKLGGMLDRFGDRTYKPLFDVRSPVREAALISKYIPNDGKPVVTLAISGGFSSPFRKKAQFRYKLSEALGDAVSLVDLNAIQFEHIYDSIALIEASDLLITADSVHMHLAAATETPTICLLSDRSAWAKTAPRCNVILSLDYHAALREVDKIAKAVTSIQHVEHQQPPRIIHAVDNFWRQRPNELRHQMAFKTWLALYRNGSMLAAVKEDPQRNTGILNSHVKAPFLKDVLRSALDRARPCDYIVWTNSDTILQPVIIGDITKALASSPIATSRRLDYRTKRRHEGRDLVALRADWLTENWGVLPDFALGHAEFDVFFALLARKVNGRESTARQILDDWAPCDIPPGNVLHLDHGVPEWDKGKNRRSSPGNIYNLRLLREWCEKNMPTVRFNHDGSVDWNH